ncbi:MAG: hypothetical protein EOP52_10575 [Sphingobacteriales bacterium]|nr:MAG: hypothetical protein EOP52_10575 [Sphingobacteriales bacterium]
MATHYVRVFAAAVALLSMASCGQDYNASPSGSDSTGSVNPLLPLGTADAAGQIRYKRWSDKIRMASGTWNEQVFGTMAVRQVTGTMTVNGQLEGMSVQLYDYKAARTSYNNNDSSYLTLVFQDSKDSGTNQLSRLYSSYSLQAKGKAYSTITVTEQNPLTMKGVFSGRVYRRKQATFEIDTNDYIEITEGSFFVNKK